MQYSKSVILTLAIFLHLGISAQNNVQNPVGNVEDILLQLDRTLENREYYENEIRAEIQKNEIEYQKAKTADEKYNALRNYFNIYRTFKLDSALILADRRLEAAIELNDPSKIASATLNLADCYAKMGDTDLAISIMDTLQQGSLAPHQIKYLNGIYKTAYSNKILTAVLPSDRMKALDAIKKLRHKELEETDKDSRGYMALQSEQLRDAGMYKEAVEMMENMAAKYPISDNAALLYEMGATYLDAGKQKSAIFPLAQSAILDISQGSKEYQSLTLLASLLYDLGDVDRAFAYINYALEDATFSKAHIRTEAIMKIMPAIYNAFSEKEREIKRRTAWFIGVIILLNLILGALIISLVRAQRVKKKMIQKIKAFNSSLENKNKNLEIADKLKMEHLKQFMMAYSSHISRLKNFRKNIYRLLKTSQYSKAVDRVKKESEDSPDSNAFQEMFDGAFLSMYPDFVDKLNGYLKEEARQTPSERLNPELRLVALMKIGVTSTNEISDMFGYSPQSVYNLRSSLRGMLDVSWDDFEKAVQEI